MMIALLCSCAVRKKSVEVKDKSLDKIEDYIVLLNMNNITNKDIYIQKAIVKYYGSNIEQEGLASIKYKRNDSIIISIKLRIGIEIGQVLITKDTVIYNDRIKGTIYHADDKYLYEKYGFEAKYIKTVFGDYVSNDKKEEQKNVKCCCDVCDNCVKTNNGFIKYKIDSKKLKVIQTEFYNERNEEIIKMCFSDFRKYGDMLYAGMIEIIHEGGNKRIILCIEKIEIGWNGNFDFKPGKGYRKKILK